MRGWRCLKRYFFSRRQIGNRCLQFGKRAQLSHLIGLVHINVVPEEDPGVHGVARPAHLTHGTPHTAQGPPADKNGEEEASRLRKARFHIFGPGN
jgi:hypothetical protein